MSPKELKSLIKLMRANGVTSLKSDGVEITLTHEALFPQAAKAKPQEIAQESEPQPWKNMTDEEIATWHFQSPQEAQ